MLSRTVKVGLKDGLEARTLAMLVQIAGNHKSQVNLECGGRRINAKSIMGMMTLAMDHGDDVTIIADGPDEESAVLEMKRFIEKS